MAQPGAASAAGHGSEGRHGVCRLGDRAADFRVATLLPDVTAELLLRRRAVVTALGDARAAVDGGQVEVRDRRELRWSPSTPGRRTRRRPSTAPKSGCCVRSCASDVGRRRGRRRPPTPSGLIFGQRTRTGSRQISLRRSTGPSAPTARRRRCRSDTIATQIRPSEPGRDVVRHSRAGSSASGVTVPACGPVSQYFDSLRAHGLGEHQRRLVGGQRHPVGEVQPVDQRRDGAVGVEPEQAAAAAASRIAPRKCSKWNALGRLGEIDCAVRLFRSRWSRTVSGRPSTESTSVVELAGGGVQREQSAVAVADQHATVARDVPAQRSATGVGDHLGARPSAAMRTMRPSTSPGPEPAVGVDDDVLRAVAAAPARPSAGRSRSGRGSGSTGGGCQRTGSIDGLASGHPLTYRRATSGGWLRPARRCRMS